MSEEHPHKTSRLGVILVFIAVGGSAVGVAGWHLMSNRSAGLDTSGFDMSAAPDPAQSAAPPSFPAPGPADPAPAQQTSLGMVKGDAGMRVAGPGASTPKPAGASGATPNPTDPRQAAALNFKEAALKNEKIVAAFVRRMEKKHTSITQYGRDWAASPELRALRDAYWKDRDPLKFAYGLAKSNDFSKLVKKYAGDPGIRDALVTGIKEAPPSLTAAIGGVAQNDGVAKSLVSTVIKAVGLPASLTGFLDGGEAKAVNRDQVMSDIMNSEDMKKAMKNQPAAVPLDAKDAEKAPEAAPNGFRPLGGR
ncbi:MAG: hypothetical protein HYV14_13890 [Elusimicrobia bacterium]|nr:hypothetical protein [Elusimicrobiota bacterium]